MLASRHSYTVPQYFQCFNSAAARAQRHGFCMSTWSPCSRSNFNPHPRPKASAKGATAPHPPNTPLPILHTPSTTHAPVIDFPSLPPKCVRHWFSFHTLRSMRLGELVAILVQVLHRRFEHVQSHCGLRRSTGPCNILCCRCNSSNGSCAPTFPERHEQHCAV